MTESSLAPDQEPARYPLSYTQEWFITLDQGDEGGTFGPRFMIVSALCVTGHVDLAVLQGALDDVVERHELLRTLVIRDADPPYQVVFPPCPVPLEILDVPPVPGASRDQAVPELIMQAEAGSISAREVPLIKAQLCRFDDRDSLLILTVHHSVSDGWSIQVTFRDLGAFYTARRTGAPAVLPPVRQYREYAAWQRANAASTADDGAPAYWRRQLDGAREFTIPNDHGHPASYSRPYSMHVHSIEAEAMDGAAALATSARSTLFIVLLSAFYVLAHQLTGDTDLAIRAFTAGRDEEQFQDTMGLFLNCVPFRTDIGGCTSFRDIVLATRETFRRRDDPRAPGQRDRAGLPQLSPPHARTCGPASSSSPTSRGSSATTPFPSPTAPAPQPSRRWKDKKSTTSPAARSGTCTPSPSSELDADVLYNLDEFDESTVAGWSRRPAAASWPPPSATPTGTGGCSPPPSRSTKATCKARSNVAGL